MRSSSGYWFLLIGFVFSPLRAGDALETAPSMLVSMSLEFETNGIVEARRQATLAAEVTGKIEAVYFAVDDVVEKGEIIVKIRDLEYLAKLEKSRALLVESRANFDDKQQDYKRVKGLRLSAI